MADWTGTAQYVFRIEFRLEAGAAGLSMKPDRFETVLYRSADPPGDSGWLFFRDTLWRGELADPEHFRRLAGEALSVTVTDATFSELRVDEPSLAAFRTAIGDHLDEFKADSVDATISKYLGSSIRVVPDSE